jgi:hypothetical protein
MQNHRDKHRDIARSVLPSTMSVSTRRRLIHKAERARVRVLLHSRPDHTLLVAGVDRVTQHDLNEMVRDRRDADHLGPLIRWAQHHATTDPRLINADHADRLGYFATILPDNLAGRHALTHIDRALRPSNLASKRSGRDDRSRVDTLIGALTAILRAGRHAELNQRICQAAGFIKGNHYTPPVTRPRLLHGEHDVAAFAQATAFMYQSRVAFQFADELQRPRTI